jgi:lysophospholipase L1-like esterase
VRRLVLPAAVLLLALALGLAGTALRRAEIELRLARTLETAPAALRAAAPPAWPDGAVRVLVAGDSRVAHWAPRPEIPGHAVVLSGIGGETAAELRRRLERDLPAHAPDRLVVATGINDLVAASLSPGAAEAVLAALLGHLAAIAALGRAAGAEVTLATILQPARPDTVRRLLFWSGDVRALVRRANDGIRALAAREGLGLLDADAALGAGPGAPLPAALATDTLHLDAAAYARLNLLLAETFRE